MRGKPYADTATEAGMLATLREAIELAGGCHYRINDSRMQSMTGFPDVFTFCPIDRNNPGGDLGLYGLEIKTARDRQRSEQVAFLDMLNRVTFCRGAIVRAGRLREQEITLDEALDMVRNGQ
jgi:hypothetical protein